MTRTQRRNSLWLCAALWAAIAAPVMTAPAFAHPGGLDTNDPSLPPIDPARYLSPDDVHADFQGPGLHALLHRPEHLAIICHDPAGGAGGGPTRTNDGVNEFEAFCSELRSGTVDLDFGNDGTFEVVGAPVSAEDQGRNTQVRVDGLVLNPIGAHTTEMLSMQLSGTVLGNPFMIRESPTRPSLGVTNIIPTGGGNFHIDSFFDVFTELSIDGGQTWIPSANSVRVDLVPEPSTYVLAMLGLAGVAAVARRKRKMA